MQLTREEKKLLCDFAEPMIGDYFIPYDIIERIEGDRLTVGCLNDLQHVIDLVLYTAGKPATELKVQIDEAQYRKMQELAAMAHFALRKHRSYLWDAPRRV